MQFLSYFIYLSCPLAESTQRILAILYYAHPSYSMQSVGIFPALNVEHPAPESILGKGHIMGKTGVYLADSLYIHIFMLFWGIVLGIAKVAKGWFYNKINPYIISYTFRLVFMEMSFGMFLFLFSIDLSTTIMRWSLALLLLDLVIIGCSFFWKIKAESDLSLSHYALFYFNELGPPMSPYQTVQNIHNKSILPSLVYYFGKIPLILIILLFKNQPLTQCICLLVFSFFVVGIELRIQYRRLMYRFLSLYVVISILGASTCALLLACSVDAGIILDGWILGSICGLLVIVLLQIGSNHKFLVSLYFWGR